MGVERSVTSRFDENISKGIKVWEVIPKNYVGEKTQFV